MFSLPHDARALVQAVDELAAGRDSYVVGGSVRDTLLGLPLADLDIAIAGDAPALARALADRLAGHYVLLDAERGTARVVLDHGTVRVIDIVSLRGDIASDLARRDFTVDAMAAPVAPLARGEAASVLDPHGGLRDLESRLVRLVSERALADDPLRQLRAVRIAAQFDFTIAPETEDAIRRNAARIEQAAAERQRDELVRCFATPRASQALRAMDRLGLLELLLPEVTAGRGVTQPKEHHWDVFDHAIETVAALDFMLATDAPRAEREAALRHALWSILDATPGAYELRHYLRRETSEGRPMAVLLKVAGLLHDVGKPETRAPDATGRVRFFGHAELGAETSRRVLRRLRFSRGEIDLVATMVEEHLRPAQLGQSVAEPPTRRALFRFFRDTGHAAEGILLLSLADALAARGPTMDVESWRGHVAYIAHVLARRHEDETIAKPVRLLSGEEVMSELAIGPGPEVGRVLRAVDDAQGAGDISTRDEALRFVRERYAGANTRASVLLRAVRAQAGVPPTARATGARRHMPSPCGDRA
jgi:putative nucleotidyltransferase with HDIG domain